MKNITSFDSIKILTHYDKIKAINANKPDYPVTFTIDFTNLCNQDCDFCLNASQRKGNNKELSIEQIKDILDLSVQIGVKGIKIAGGGEPLAHSKILNLLNLLKTYDGLLDFGLTTNGTLLTPDIFDMINDIKSFKYISISIETFDREIYKKIRKYNIKDNFECNLEYANKNKKTVKINAGILIHNESYKKLYSTVIKIKDLGFDSAIIKPLAFNSGYEYNYRIDENVLTNEINKSKKLGSDRFILKHASGRTDDKFQPIFEYSNCKAIYLGGVWGADSKFHLCCDRRNDGLYLFDFSKEPISDFKKYWANDEHVKRVSSIVPNIDCPRCTYNNYNKILNNFSDIFEELI